MRIAWEQFRPVVTYANLLHCNPGYVFGPRRIREHQFIFIVKGRGRAAIQQREYAAEPGDLFYYGPAVTHRFAADEQEPFTVYGVHFNVDGLLTDKQPPAGLIEQGEAERDNALWIGEEGDGGFRVPERSRNRDGSLQTMFRNVYYHYERDGADHALMNRSLLMQIVVMLRQRNREADTASATYRGRLSDHVRDNLRQHAGHPYNRQWLSEWTDYNPDYAARLFKALYGVTPHDYHMEQKIEMAKEWLAGTSESVSHIAEALHFGTVHYFSRVFKASTGSSPLAYRNLRKMI